MGKLRSNGKLDLEGFVRTYVYSAFDIVKANPDIKLDNFDTNLRKIIADEFKITAENVKFLHHIFHSAFFCNKDISPLTLEAEGMPDFYYKVALKRQISEDDSQKIIDYILSDYKKKDYLQARINILYQQS